MYNIRKKLCSLAVLMFALSFILPRVFDKTAPAHSGMAADYTGTRTALQELGEDKEHFVAHRGYSNYAPENSIPAFEFAGKMRFWGIETDISQTLDGAFVCMHDDELDRTTDGEGLVGDHTLDEIRLMRIDTGSNVDTVENLIVPSLGEYLEICRKYDCIAVIEIKKISDYDAFLSEIGAHEMLERCIITGGINDVKEIRARNADVPVMTIGYSSAPYTDNLTAIAEVSQPRGILFNYPQVDKAAIDAVHAQDVYCGVWSVDYRELAGDYADWGADFIVTNELPATLQTFDEE